MTFQPQGVSSIPPSKLEEARDYYEQFLAFVEVGFTEEQATLLLSRPRVTVNSHYPPEVYEFWERQNALALTLQDELKDE